MAGGQRDGEPALLVACNMHGYHGQYIGLWSSQQTLRPIPVRTCHAGWHLGVRDALPYEPEWKQQIQTHISLR